MYFGKLKKLFLEPSKFFKDVAKEKKYWDILKVFLFVYLIASAIQIIISIIVSGSVMNAQVATFIMSTLVVAIVASLVMPFVVSFLAHLGILILRGKKGYFNTFKAITYGGLIWIVYNILSTLISGIISLTNPSNGPVVGLVVGAISIVGFVHALIIQAMGVSKFHSISSGKALLGIILVPLMIIIGIIAISGINLASFIG
jgi:hypothetical protein